jgi:hydroxylamine reductase
VAPPVPEKEASVGFLKFVVMAGCDGRVKSREYYARFAEQLPSDTVIMTAGCA